MKTSRIKTQGYAHQLDFEIAVERIAFAQNEMLALELRRDAIIQRVREKFALKIAELELEINLKAALCEKFAEEHRAELLPDETKSKTRETANACYGFALANKKAVKPVSKKIDEETIIATLKANHLGGYVRTVEEIAKEKIITDAVYDEELKALVLVTSVGSRVILAEVGLKLVQGETFFIRPKAESAETVKAGGAS